MSAINNALATMEEADPWAWWREALSGNRGELTRGDPKTGYYRDRQRAIAIWRNEDGALCCYVSSGFVPRNDEEIDDLFGFCSMNPISYETYESFVGTGRWPEDPTAEIEAAREIPSADRAVSRHDNNPPPEEAIADEIATTKRAFEAWLKEVGGGIATEEHDAKAKRFQDVFQTLAKKADDAFEDEKAEIRKRGQEIDARWRGPRQDARAGKDFVGSFALEYRKERKRKQDEAARQAKDEADRQRAEQARLRAQAEATNRPPPPETPIIAPTVRKQATGLRTTTDAEITDLPALAGMIAAIQPTPPDFLDVCRKVALNLLKNGVDVKGAKLVERVRA